MQQVNIDERMSFTESWCNKMGVEIGVVKKNGPWTLKQLYLILGTPIDVPRENYKLKFADHNLKVSNGIFLNNNVIYISK